MSMMFGRPKGAPTNTGITLIALIITIIILLILAGVAIHFTLGENGILRNAETAGKKYSEATVKETIQNILADMQMEEIKNGRKLDLEKLAQNLASKDNNIAITEYEEGASELKGTYTINGQEYEFTINNKFEVEVKKSTGEKIVKIEEIIWENGKPKVTLTSNQEGTIEYKDENGEWKPYNEDVNVKEGDTLTVRVNMGAGTTKEETIVIKDKTTPTEFAIEIASEFIKSKSVTVNLKTIPVDNETGLKDYTYVAETNGSKKEITNITATSYQITELTPETSYTVYVLAYDNAGNYRKSNAVTITTTAYIPPTVSAATTHTAHNLDDENGDYCYTWEEIEELAKIISDDNRSTITYTTPEVIIVKDEKTYTLGAGDYKNVTYDGVAKRVRILGFNHDTLSETNQYGGINTYAGISFEFADYMIDGYFALHDTSETINGWKECTLRLNILKNENTLNNIKTMDNKSIGKIKEVTKIYNIGNKESINDTCEDKLWLLACSEIWQTGATGCAAGYCLTNEGNQYALYQINIGSASYSKSNSLLAKYWPSGNRLWWLRSPSYNDGKKFCLVHAYGYCKTPESASWAYVRVSPGFCL